MKRIVAMTALAGLVISAAFAQRGMGRGFGDSSGVMLLQRTDVRADLKLTDEQKDKLTALQDEAQQEMQAMFQRNRGNGGGGGGRGNGPSAEQQAAMKKFFDEQKAKVAKILDAGQMKRLREINIQMAGNSAAAWEDVQKELGLSETQVASIKDVQKKQRDEMRAMFEKMRAGGERPDPETMRATRKQMTEKTNSAIGAVLTDKQKDKLKELGGAKFEADPDEEG